MKISLLVLLLCWCAAPAFAQTDSLRNEIMQYDDPQVVLMGKARRLIIDKIKEDDKQKVSEVLNYLLSLESNYYQAFYPYEEILLFYYTGNFEKVLTEYSNQGITYYGRRDPFIRPPHDHLFALLGEKLMAGHAEIIREIEDIELAAADKEFLKLYLNYQLQNIRFTYQNEGYVSANFLSTPQLNDQATKFLEAHPNSAYENYVRERIRHQYKPSDWGFGWELFIGYGRFKGELADKFRNSVPFGIGLEAHYRRAVMQLTVNFFDFSVRDSVVIENTVWRRNTRLRSMWLGNSVGVGVLDKNQFRLTPFAGIAGTWVAPQDHEIEKYPEYENTKLKFTPVYSVGLQTDFKLTDILGYTAYNAGYSSIRLRYTYQLPQFFRHYSGFGGAIHNITIGFGHIERKQLRVL